MRVYRGSARECNGRERIYERETEREKKKKKKKEEETNFVYIYRQNQPLCSLTHHLSLVGKVLDAVDLSYCTGKGERERRSQTKCVNSHSQMRTDTG